MATTLHTPNYGLSQYGSTDPVKILTNYNDDMTKIDTGIKAAKDKADAAVPSTRKLNGYDMTADRSLNAADVGAIGDNILINPDGTINQRRQSSYAVAGNYTVDRWQNGAPNTIITPNNPTGIHLTSSYSGVGILLIQSVENYSKYQGKTLTATIKFHNYVNGGNNLYFNIADGVNSTTGVPIVSDSGIVSFTLKISDFASYLRIWVSKVGTTAMSIDIDWMKLELGEVFTGYAPPDNALERMKCNWFNYIANSERNQFKSFGIGYAVSTTQALIQLYIANMRQWPTITYSGSLAVYSGYLVQSVSITALTSENGTTDGLVTLRVTVGGGLTAGAIYELISNNDPDAKIKFDSEMY